MLILLLLVLGLMRVDSLHSWGYQSDNRNFNIIETDIYGDVYVGGSSFFSPHRCFISKFKQSDGEMVLSFEESNSDSSFSSDCTVSKISFDNDNNIYFTGNKNAGRLYASKLDARGNFFWEYSGDKIYQTSKGIVVNSDNNVFILAYSGMGRIIDLTEHTPYYSDLGSGAETNNYVVKLSPDGNLEWSVYLLASSDSGGYKQNMFQKVYLASDGNVTVEGLFYDYVANHYQKEVQILDAADGSVLFTSIESSHQDDYNSQFAASNVAVYGDNVYNVEMIYNRHIYGTNHDHGYSYIIIKNVPYDGFYLAPSSTSTSESTACGALSYSIFALKEGFYYTTCPFYSYHVNVTILIIGIVCFLLALVIIMYCIRMQFVAVVTSMLSFFSFTCDVVYVLTVPTEKRTIFILITLFLFIPIIDFCGLVYRMNYEKQIKLFFPPTFLVCPWLVIGNKENMPVIFNCNLLAPMDENYKYIIMAFSWIAAIFVQMAYLVVWSIATLFVLLPWSCVHLPYYTACLTLGYVLYMFKIFPQEKIRLQWNRLLFTPVPPSLVAEGNDDAHTPAKDAGDYESEMKTSQEEDGDVEILSRSTTNPANSHGLAGGEGGTGIMTQLNHVEEDLDIESSPVPASPYRSDFQEVKTSLTSMVSSSLLLKNDKLSHDVSWMTIVSTIAEVILENVPHVTLQCLNNGQIHKFPLISIFSLIAKSLLFLNLINRIAILYGSDIKAYTANFYHRLVPITEAFFSSLNEMEEMNHSDSSDGSQTSISKLLEKNKLLEHQVKGIPELLLRIEFLENRLRDVEKGSTD